MNINKNCKGFLSLAYIGRMIDYEKFKIKKYKAIVLDYGKR